MKSVIAKLDKLFNDWPYHKDSDLEVPGTPLTWKELYALYKMGKSVEEEGARLRLLFETNSLIRDSDHG